MERLTKREEKPNRHSCKAGCKLNSESQECCYAGCVNFQEVQNRLAAYEDTGLTPAEVAEIVQAKQEGRLAVLPEGLDDAIRLFAHDLINYETNNPPNLLYKNETEKYALMRNWSARAKLLRSIPAICEAAEAGKERISK